MGSWDLKKLKICLMSGHAARRCAQSSQPASDPTRVQGPGLHSLPSALPFRLPGRMGWRAWELSPRESELCHLVASGVQAPARPSVPGPSLPFAGGSRWQCVSAPRWQQAPPCTSEVEEEKDRRGRFSSPRKTLGAILSGLEKGQESSELLCHRARTHSWLAGGGS